MAHRSNALKQRNDALNQRKCTNDVQRDHAGGSVPELPEPVLRFEAKAQRSQSRMLKHVANHSAQPSLFAPADCRVVFVTGAHGGVAFSTSQPCGDHPGCTQSRIQSVPHPFPAKRINHPGRITDRQEV